MPFDTAHRRGSRGSLFVGNDGAAQMLAGFEAEQTHKPSNLRTGELRAHWAIREQFGQQFESRLARVGQLGAKVQILGPLCSVRPPEGQARINQIFVVRLLILGQNRGPGEVCG